MNEEQLASKIQEKINAEKITPLPKWRFTALRVTAWTTAVLAVFICGVSVGTIIFLSEDHSHHDFFNLSHDMTEFFLAVPFAWVAILAIFIFVAELCLRHTKQGYRYRLRTLLVVSVLASIVLGLILNIIGLGKATHETLNEVPLYNAMIYDARDAWGRPHNGRLGGVIVVVKDKRTFEVNDFVGKRWTIRLSSSTGEDYTPEASTTIRMYGVVGSSSTMFNARSIHRWER